MTTNLTRLATASVLSLSLSASVALAGSVTQPGETVGAQAGAPPPPGLYFINTFDWGHRTGVDVDVAVTIPVLAWSTPWTIFGGRLIFLAATPAVAVHPPGPLATNDLDIYNPLFAGQLAWDLGNGFNFSYLLGAYFDIHSQFAWSSTSLNQRFAFTYNRDGWNLTANLIWGIQFDEVSNRPQLSPCPPPFGLNGCNPKLREPRPHSDQEIRPVGNRRGRIRLDRSQPAGPHLPEAEPVRRGRSGWLRLRSVLGAGLCHDRRRGRELRRQGHAWMVPRGSPARKPVRDRTGASTGTPGEKILEQIQRDLQTFMMP